MTNNNNNNTDNTMITKLDKALTVNFVFDSLDNETILNPSFFVIGVKLNKAMKTNGIATRHFSEMMKQLEDKITLRKETLETKSTTTTCREWTVRNDSMTQEEKQEAARACGIREREIAAAKKAAK
jgi:hypothetical protein